MLSVVSGGLEDRFPLGCLCTRERIRKWYYPVTAHPESNSVSLACSSFVSLITCQMGMLGVIMALQPQATGALPALGAHAFVIVFKAVHGPGCELRHTAVRLSITIYKYTA